MISALLVDDEPRANEMMRKLLAAHAEIEIIGVAENVAEARRFLEATPPDVVFLDIDMPGDSGLDLLVSVPDATQVVFVTASDKHAVRAFAAAALDYLVKPVDPERLADTVARVRRHVAGKSGTDGPDIDEADIDEADADDPDADEADAAEVLGLDAAVSVTLAGKTTLSVVNVSDICWIESLRNYSRVALKSPQGVLLYNRRLSHWDAILPTDVFARVGRSHIVQVATVNQIEWKSRNETVVTFEEGADPLTLGRVAAKRLREILTGHE
jgi:two-component system LytT family response regulator